MDNINYFFLIISAVVAYQVTKEIFTIHKTDSKISEARNFFENYSDARTSQNLKTEEYEVGLALVKKGKNEKYELIPQKKLTGLSLS